MTMKRWDGAAFQDLATAKRWDGASWIDLTVAKRWDGASWADIPLPGGGAGDLSATASRSTCDGTVIVDAPAPLFRNITSNTVTITATGGTGVGPTYSWARVSGSSAISATVPTGATTAFTASVGSNQTLSAVFRCTITRGAESVTIDVTVFLSYYVETGA